ncbi:MAG: hypothetical protein AB1824_01220 [Acidobacteriota bacterium]
MSWSLQLRLKDGSFQDVPLLESEAGSLSQKFEDYEARAVFDDLSLTLDNSDGFWSTLFSAANLTPTDAYPNRFGFRLLQGGTPFWEGDLDYESVTHNSAKSVTEVRVLDAIKRLEAHNAENLKRDYSSLAIVSGARHSKNLVVNSVLDASGEPLSAGDELELAHVKPNTKIGKQTLVVASVNLGTNTITFKKRLRFNYGPSDAIVVKNPWLRGWTAGALIEALLDLVPGFDAAHRVIDYDGVTWDDTVDIADFEGKDAGAAVTLVADWVNAQVFSRAGVIHVVGREKDADGAPVQDLSGLVGAEGANIAPAGHRRYDLVVIRGRDGRQVRKGLSPFGGNKLEKDFPFTKDRTQLLAVASRYWDYWGRVRQKAEGVPVWDDATAYVPGKRVTLDGVEYRVVQVGQDLEDGGELTLDLVAKSGTLPDPGSYDEDDLTDDDEDPPEPTGLVFTKSYSTTFNTLFPSDKYKRLTTVREVDEDGNLISETKMRLFELRWAYPYDELGALVWRFQITVWPDAKDREKPKRVFTVPPDQQSDGLYYAKVRLPAGKLWWADVVAILDDLRESPPSDENSSGTEDDTVEGTPAPNTFVMGTISSVESEPHGSSAKRCDCSITFTVADCTEAEVVLTDSTTGKTHRLTVLVEGAAGAAYFPPQFKRGGTLTVTKVVCSNGSAKATFSNPGTWATVAGGSALPGAPLAPSITGVTRVKKGDEYAVSVAYDGSHPVSLLRRLRLYTAPTGTTGTPDTNTAWKLRKTVDIEADVTAATPRTSYEITDVRSGTAIRAAILKVEDCHKQATYSVIYDAGTVPASDDTPPALPSLTSLTSTERDVPGTRRVECDLSAAFTFAGCTDLVVETKEYDGTTLKDADRWNVRVEGLSGLTFYKKAVAAQGRTIYLRWKGVNGTASSAWSTADGAGGWGDNPPTVPVAHKVTAGSSLPAAPAITGLAIKAAKRDHTTFQVQWSGAAGGAYKELLCEQTVDGGTTWEPLKAADIWPQRTSGKARYSVQNEGDYQLPVVRFWIRDKHLTDGAYYPSASGTTAAWWATALAGGSGDGDQGVGQGAWADTVGAAWASDEVTFSGAGWRGRQARDLPKKAFSVSMALKLSAYGSAYLGVLSTSGAAPYSGYALRFSSTTAVDLFVVTAGTPGATPVASLALSAALPTTESFPVKIEIHAKKILVTVGQTGEGLVVQDTTHRIAKWHAWVGSKIGSWSETVSTLVVEAASVPPGRLWDAAAARDLLSIFERASDGHLTAGGVKVAVLDGSTEYARVLQAAAVLLPTPTGNSGGTPSFTSQPVLKGSMLVGGAINMANMPTPSADLMGTPFLYRDATYGRKICFYAWDPASSSYEVWWGNLTRADIQPSGSAPPGGGDDGGGSCFWGQALLRGPENRVITMADVQVGDLVLSRYRGKDAYARVTAKRVHRVPSCLLLNGCIGVTPEHLLFAFVPSEPDLTVSAGGCVPGTRLYGIHGPVTVGCLELHAPPAGLDVYSITVDLGRYWIGGKGLWILAHNLKELG